MSTQLCFFRDLDSFEVHSDVLEVIYQTKAFRFGYPSDVSDDRKFSVKLDRNVHVMLPKMTLQYQNDGVWLGIHVIDFGAEFIDMVKFANLIGKLSNVAGYQQLIVPDDDVASNMERDSENSEEEFEEEIEDESECDESPENISMLPQFKVLKDFTAMTVDQNYIELVVAGQTHCFAHRPGPQRREYGRRGLSRTLPKGKAQNWLIPGVILQCKPAGWANYEDAFPVDLYIEFEKHDLYIELGEELSANNYVGKKN